MNQTRNYVVNRSGFGIDKEIYRIAMKSFTAVEVCEAPTAYEAFKIISLKYLQLRKEFGRGPTIERSLDLAYRHASDAALSMQKFEGVSLAWKHETY